MSIASLVLFLITVRGASGEFHTPAAEPKGDPTAILLR
jgi:hypothetical protein